MRRMAMIEDLDYNKGLKLTDAEEMNSLFLFQNASEGIPFNQLKQRLSYHQVPQSRRKLW